MKLKNYLKWIVAAMIICIFGILFIIRQDGQDGTYVQEMSVALSESVYEQDTKAEEQVKIFVEICGCVNNPGVYEVMQNSRVYQVIELAGGLSENAMGKAVNQAAFVNDGQQIYIPSVEEGAAQNNDVSDGSIQKLVNINSAEKEELMSLPGIGESKALAVIAYRENNGRFGKVEDIMNVSGIKEAAFNKIKELICV